MKQERKLEEELLKSSKTGMTKELKQMLCEAGIVVLEDTSRKYDISNDQNEYQPRTYKMWFLD